MKFNLALTTTIIMLTVASAMPAEDTFAITDTTFATDGTEQTDLRNCRKDCWHKKHKCDKGWYTHKQGHCWTCCKD
jgi:hypothetical protein